jgi:hypothetical protein
MDDSSFGLYILLWIVAVLLVALAPGRRRNTTTGLVFAYIFSFWLLHWVAASFYLLPWYSGYARPLVEAGLEQSLYGIAAFGFGSIVMRLRLIRRRKTELPYAGLRRQDRKLPLSYIYAGIISYLLMSTALASLPSATAIVVSGQQLIVIGVALNCWLAWQAGDPRRLALWVGAAYLFPLMTIHPVPSTRCRGRSSDRLPWTVCIRELYARSRSNKSNSLG